MTWTQYAHTERETERDWITDVWMVKVLKIYIEPEQCNKISNNIMYIYIYKLISDKFSSWQMSQFKIGTFINDIYFIIIQMKIEVSAKVNMKQCTAEKMVCVCVCVYFM